MKWSNTPSREELITVLIDSFKSRKKKRNESPIVNYVTWYNSTHTKDGWLIKIASKKSVLLSIVLFFFYEKNLLTILMKAINNDTSNSHAINEIPGLKIFKHYLTKLYVRTNDPIKFKTILIDAVVRSYSNIIKDNNPIVSMLSEENEN